MHTIRLASKRELKIQKFNTLKKMAFFTAFGVPNGLYQYGIHAGPFSRKFSIWNPVG